MQLSSGRGQPPIVQQDECIVHFDGCSKMRRTCDEKEKEKN